jgi:hypothetical protein
MNVEIGAEASEFPEKTYINGIFIAVQRRNTPRFCRMSTSCPTARGANILNGTFSPIEGVAKAV